MNEKFDFSQVDKILDAHGREERYIIAILQ